MYEINSSNPNPIVNYEGISRNVTTVGFHEDGHWMYTGGEDCSARVWDLRYYNWKFIMSRLHRTFFFSDQEVYSAKEYFRYQPPLTVFAFIQTKENF